MALVRESRKKNASSRVLCALPFSSALHLRVARGRRAVLRRVAGVLLLLRRHAHGDLLLHGRVHGALLLRRAVSEGAARGVTRGHLDVLLREQAAADRAPEDVGDAVEHLRQLVDLCVCGWGVLVKLMLS